MKKIGVLFALSLFLAPHAIAADTAQQTKMKDCNAQAKDMKGDERKAFMKTCLSAPKEDKKGAMKEEKAATEDKKGAVKEEKAATEGKKSAQQEKMKKCNADAKTQNLTGDERKEFMKSCLSG
jgi:psiF repeat